MSPRIPVEEERPLGIFTERDMVLTGFRHRNGAVRGTGDKRARLLSSNRSRQPDLKSHQTVSSTVGRSARERSLTIGRLDFAQALP